MGWSRGGKGRERGEGEKGGSGEGVGGRCVSVSV